MHCWGQRSCGVSWGQVGVNLLSTALWPPNLMVRIPDQSVCIAGVKGHVGVSWGQVGVNLLSNALWPPNLVGRTPDQSVMHCWGQGHAGVSQGQPEVKFLRNALWLPNLVERTPDQSAMHWWGQRSCKGQLGCSQCYRVLCSCRCSSSYNKLPQLAQSQFGFLQKEHIWVNNQ